MILLQNPSIPVATNAVEIDAAIIDIRNHLDSGLVWLTNGYGRAYKNVDTTQGTTVFYPEIYLGEQNNSQRYTNISPDNDKQGQCFFFVTKETISQFQTGMYSFLSYDTAIIFSVNMELISAALLGTEIYQQILVAQVRDVLTRQLLGSSYQLKINSVDFLFDNVFSEFDLKDAEQLEKAPLSHFRFNCSITLPEDCPTPSLPCYSMLMDGVIEYVNATNATNFSAIDFNLPFTFSVWAKASSLSGVQILLGKRDPSTGEGLWLGFNGATIRFGLVSIPFKSYTISTTSTFSVGAWYNITGTFDGIDATGLNIFVNGVLQPVTINFNNLGMVSILNSIPVTFGAGFNEFYFDGYISSARIWSIELSASEVLSEYNNKNNAATIQTASLILSSDINNSTFNGSEWVIPDLTGITQGYTSVNMEVSDKIEDCPT